MNGIPVFFTLIAVDADPNEAISYQYSLDTPALDQAVDGFGRIGLVEIAPIETGEHVLYLQGVSANGEKSELVEFAFSVDG